ncbi:MAG TPA: NADPH-dependent FMN reductase [Bacteroidia bacterium]|nr:NADPH-dependent FMN reductase [Bacteroidia bacterium]
MSAQKNILAIVGSASSNSSNHQLLNYIKQQTQNDFNLTVFNSLANLPHFNTELSIENTPQVVLDFRTAIQNADGILICTPEYVFSIPAGLKNAIEWCVSTTVFAHKPTALITASASGVKAHEELQLIMQTIEANFTNDTTLLIQGIKSKINTEGNITHPQTKTDLAKFITAYKKLIHK